jgi:hypothetical protein
MTISKESQILHLETKHVIQWNKDKTYSYIKKQLTLHNKNIPITICGNKIEFSIECDVQTVEKIKE